MKGFQPIFDDQVRFVLIDGYEVAAGTLIRWLFTHLALGTATAGLLTLAWRHGRARARQEPAGNAESLT